MICVSQNLLKQRVLEPKWHTATLASIENVVNHRQLAFLPNIYVFFVSIFLFFVGRGSKNFSVCPPVRKIFVRPSENVPSDRLSEVEKI